MRLRIGVVLCLFAVIWAAGCRKPLTPVVDTDLAPETWITAAPMDSITLRDEHGIPIPPDDSPRKIPIRFHLYWAGSDPDGAIAGFYWAVTETIASSDPTLPIPPVPGPKPQDYRFTTRTDSTFIFSVTPDHPDRDHAFFIYSVDNRGKADPTPARFYFRAFDNPRYQPIPLFTLARATGYYVPYAPHQPVRTLPDTVDITDIQDPATGPRDTCAANARLDFAWSAKIVTPGNDVRQFCYTLDDPKPTCGGPSMQSASFNNGIGGAPPISVGRKVFRLQLIDAAGGGVDSSRRVFMNRAPDSWFWGPDLNDPHFTQVREGSSGDVRYMELSADWPGIPGTGLSADSFTVMPVDRPERRTFFEIWRPCSTCPGRIYAHGEGDTVHINSWCVFFSGGYDKDSKYRVQVSPLDRPSLPDSNLTPVLNPRPENGSPIGFRTQLVMRRDPNGSFLAFLASGLAPVFDPLSPERNRQIGSYWPVQQSGRAFIVTRAEDGDRLVDPTVPGSPSDPVLHEEAGTATDAEKVARHKVLAFYVNKAPYFLSCDPNFIPTADDPTCPGTPYAGPYAFHGQAWQLNLLAHDPDPYDPDQRSFVGTGQATATEMLRIKISVLGKDLAGNDRVWVYYPTLNTAPPYLIKTFDVNMSLSKVFAPLQGGLFTSAADSLQTGDVTLRVQLCDCHDCELNDGEGVCITKDFPAIYSPTLEAASSERRGLPR